MAAQTGSENAGLRPEGCAMNLLFRGWLFISLSFLVMLYPSASAQNKHWRKIQGKPLIKFDWNCASSSVYPKSKLGRQVKTVLRKEKYAEGMPDRAFACDLNLNSKPEYFIPLVCGATGNCTWGVFTLGPTQFLGTVDGQYIYVHKLKGSWPVIITYGHLSASEGVLDTYVFRNGRYRLSGKGYPIGPEDHTFLEIQNVRGHKMPRFLSRARSACKNLGL